MLSSVCVKELNRAYETDKTIPARLISYLLGIRDFYKVVAVDKKQLTEFQSFNFRGELNKDGKKTKGASEKKSVKSQLTVIK